MMNSIPGHLLINDQCLQAIFYSNFQIIENGYQFQIFFYQLIACVSDFPSWVMIMYMIIISEYHLKWQVHSYDLTHSKTFPLNAYQCSIIT